jgi:hypothetical protein
MSLALEVNPSLLSGFPRQLATSWSQKIAIPVFYFIILSWLPLWLFQRSDEPRPSMAIGQFMLFRRDEYWRIGGHEAVKSRIMEDVWLGVEVVRHGGYHVAVDLSSVVSTHMYRSLGAMWQGFAKCIYSVAAFSPAALIGLMVIAFVFFLAPFYWLWRDLFASAVPGATATWRYAVMFQVAVILLMRWLVDRHFKNNVISTVLHPVGLGFFFANGLYAFSRRARGGGIYWKQRRYGRGTGVE